MNEEMKAAQTKLRTLLDAHPVTTGAYVRVHGKQLVVGRQESFGPNEKILEDDRIRLTLIGNKKFGLSIRHHTGRWEKVPFSGTMEKVVNDMLCFMQHILAPHHF